MSANETIQLDFAPLPIASTPPKGVDLWFLDLSKFTHKPHAEFSPFVTTDELIRAKQFKHNSSHFLATRALLRAIIAHYTGMNALDLLFAREAHGKPFLSNAPASIHFNLSHNDAFAVLAVSAKNSLGVDIESINSRSYLKGSRNYLKIAKRYFHEDELQALTDCAESERGKLFYKFWTLKEAFFKATGGGISSGLDKIFFRIDDEKIVANINPALGLQNHAWQFHQEFIAPDTVVALVLNSTHPIQHQWLNGNALLNGM